MAAPKKKFDNGVPAFLDLRLSQKERDAAARKLPKPSKAATAEVVYITEQARAESLLAGYEQDVQDLVRAEIKAGRFNWHWLFERGIMREFTRGMREAAEKKEERFAKLKELAAAKKAERAEIKAARVAVVFGATVTIKKVLPNKRKPGTRAHGIYEAMAAYMKKHPGCPVSEMMAATGYRKDDFNWDCERKQIVTDVYSQTKAAASAPVQAPPKKEEPKKAPAKKAAPKKKGKK